MTPIDGHASIEKGLTYLLFEHLAFEYVVEWMYSFV